MKTLWYEKKTKSTDFFLKVNKQVKKAGTFGHPKPSTHEDYTPSYTF